MSDTQQSAQVTQRTAFKNAQKGLTDTEIRKVNSFFKPVLTLITMGEIDKAKSNFSRRMEQGDKKASFGINNKMETALNKMFRVMTEGPSSKEKREALKKDVAKSTKRKSLMRRAARFGGGGDMNPSRVKPELAKPPKSLLNGGVRRYLLSKI